MGNFYNPSITRKATKKHRCAYCGEAIRKGTEYSHQKGRHEGKWFDARMHHECYEDLCEIGDGEYTLYSNERPRPFQCRFCGSPSWVDPRDQVPPLDYCNESDHGEPYA